MSFLSPEEYETLLPLAGAWAAEQERAILQSGVALTDKQIADARRVGVRKPECVRLLGHKNTMNVLTLLLRFSAALALGMSGLNALSHPLDTWHTRQPGSGSGYLQDVCYGNGLFVAVGINGKAVTSSTGETWSLQTTGTTVLLEGVAYGNGLFVAVGDSGKILSSPDGTNWTTQVSGVTAHLYSVRFGGSLFVAAGNNVILTSQDGLLWNTQTSGLPFQSTFIAYGNGIFVLQGSTGWNVASKDGTNWFARPSGTDQGIYTMGFGDGVFLSIDQKLRTFTSPDASNWVQQTSVVVGRPAAVAFGNGHFVTGGSGGMEYTRKGGTWTLAPAACLPRGICFGNGTFVAAGYAEAIVQSDPVVWIQINAPGTLEIFGPIEKTYRVDSMSILSGQTWSSRTNMMLSTNPCLWSDPEVPMQSPKFYRAVMQP